MKQSPIAGARSPGSVSVPWILVVAVVLLTGLAGSWYLLRPSAQPETASPSSAAQHETQARARFSPDQEVDRDMVQRLDWRDVEDFVEAFGADSVRAEEAIEITRQLANPVAVYLRGMLYLGRQQPDAALEAFAELPLDSVPPEFVYPAFRLQQSLHPGAPNRYFGVLRKAARGDRLAPLTRARIQAQDGLLAASLQSYLQTDPAEWTRYDAVCIERIHAHEGLRGEVGRMLAGATRSGRLPGEVEAALRDIGRQRLTGAGSEQSRDGLREVLSRDPDARRLAVASARRLLEARRLFVQRDYDGLLGAYEQTTPLSVPTETAMMLFLSAVETQDRTAIDRWGQELIRRHDDQEVREWVRNLSSPAP